MIVYVLLSRVTTASEVNVVSLHTETNAHVRVLTRIYHLCIYTTNTIVKMSAYTNNLAQEWLTIDRDRTTRLNVCMYMQWHVVIYVLVTMNALTLWYDTAMGLGLRCANNTHWLLYYEYVLIIIISNKYTFSFYFIKEKKNEKTEQKFIVI